MSDKARNPHWFCWPGQYWTGDAGDGAVREFAKTVLANEPLLMCSGEGRKVRYLPPLSIRRPDDQAQRHLAYSLIKTAIFRDIHRQIVSRPGPLSFAYTWIDPNASADNYRSMVVKEVEATLKRGLDEFQPYPS
jgi:hypothetical protein